jgi:ABC-type transport system involved in cytochrome c biogenesis permease subunit
VIVILQVFSWLVFISYLVSFGYYLFYFRTQRQETEGRLRIWLAVAAASHTLYLILLGLQLQHIPVGDVFQVLTTCAWFFVLVYLITEIRAKVMTMGVFFIPIILILHGISSAFIDFKKPLPELLSTILLFEVHVAIMISAYAAFSISFISSIMYILLAREMRTRKLGIFFQRLPSLEYVDKLSNQAVNIGLIVVSLGIVLGFYMGTKVWEGRWALDPKLLAVVISWAIYLAHYVTRKIIGWQGLRAAVVSVVGFNWLLFSFIIVNLFFSKFHNFQ